MSDLANHLREHADRVAGGGTGEPEYDPETLVLEHEAADRIEELEAEVERLNAAWSECAAAWSADRHRLRLEVRALDAEIERLRDSRDELRVELEAALAQKEVAQGEAERLRETLRQVGDITNCSAVNYIVRAALAGEGDENE